MASRPPRGIYVDGDRITRVGYRDREPRGTEQFVDNPDGADLLASTEDPFAELRWDGRRIARRPQADIDADLKARRKASLKQRLDTDPLIAAIIDEAGLDRPSLETRIDAHEDTREDPRPG